jgi:hypothetical protein
VVARAPTTTQALRRCRHRTDELAALAERLGSDRGEYFVLYGRRRVDKSELLLKFGEGWSRRLPELASK